MSGNNTKKNNQKKYKILSKNTSKNQRISILMI